MDLIYWDHYYDKILLGNLVIVIALFAAMRWFSGWMERIDSSNELLIKDNPAFGISLAGKVFGIAIVLSGMIFGGNVEMVYSVGSVLLTGLSSVFFMAVAHVIFTKITLSKIVVRNEIVRGNSAVAMADTGNILAAAIILRAITEWLPPYGVTGLVAFVAAFAISQVLFTCTTLLKIKFFSLINRQSSLIQELKAGNRAVAMVFAGRKIGTAFAISLAANVIATESNQIGLILFTWFLVSILTVIAFEILCFIATKLILYKVDIQSEIVAQKNVALGALQAVIYISLGYLLSQF